MRTIVIAGLASLATLSISIPSMLLLHMQPSWQPLCAAQGLTEAEASSLAALGLLAEQNARRLRNVSAGAVADQQLLTALALELRAGSLAGAMQQPGALVGAQQQPTSAASAAAMDAAAAAVAAAAALAVPQAPLPPPPAEASESPEWASPWLRFAVVSVARTGGADYLLRTLHAIFEELPVAAADPLRRSTDVVVVNNNEPAEAHSVFLQAREYFESHTPPVNTVNITHLLWIPRTL